MDYNDSPAIVVEDNPEDVTGVTEDVTGATAGFLEGRGSQEKGKRVQLRSIAVKPPGHRVSYKETLRLSPTIPPIQLSPYVLFIIFYYISPKNSSPYNSFSPTIPPISIPPIYYHSLTNYLFNIFEF